LEEYITAMQSALHECSDYQGLDELNTLRKRLERDIIVLERRFFVTCTRGFWC
jgi:hypothetical protein